MISPGICPRCGRADAARLDYSSTHAWVDYYRCPACGHVWTMSRDGSGRRDVTQYPGEPAEFTLAVHCGQCHAAVDVLVEDGPDALDARLQSWACPGCRAVNTTHVVGRVAGAGLR